MNLRRLMLWCVVMVPTLAIAMHVHAQTSKGIIVGVVRDQSGAVIANATVTVTSEETTEFRRTTANDHGEFRIDAVNPGDYAVHVEAPSFQSVDARNLNVPPSVVTSYNPVLGTGSVAETVTVNATTNGINTENGELSSTVSTTELSQVPIFSLNPFELLQNIPGAQIVDPNLGFNGIGGNFVQIEVNGARPRSNNYMMDGQDINDIGIGGQAFNIAIPDAFQNITALTNSASAEYGRSGGAVINLVTKSGTNQFHGDLWDVYTGSGLDSLDGITRQAKPFTSNPKARYDEHQFGFTAGGPIWKNKLYGFGGLQLSRFYGNSQPGAVVLPDPAGYAQLTAIGGPQVALLQSYLGGGTYLNTFNNVGATGSFKISPRPGCAAGCTVTTAEFERPPVPQQEPDTQWLFRVDFIPSTRDTFSYRYLHDRANFNPDLGLNTSGLPGFDGEVGGPAEVAQGTWTHVFSPRLLNEFRASETRTNFLFAPTPEAAANPLFRAPEIEFSGSGLANQNTPLGMSFNIPQGSQLELYQFQDTVSWTRGAHTIRVGADIGRQLDIEIVAQNSIGLLEFTSGGGGASVLDNFLDNYLGPSGLATKTFGPTRIDPHSWKSAVFVQDDVKVTPDLTLNVGLRYDYLTSPENSMKYPAIDINDPFAPIDTVIKVKSDFNNFGPRLGFAWNPHMGFFADGKTAFHGGIGVFYDTDFTNIATNNAQASPNAPTGTLQSGALRMIVHSSAMLPGPSTPQALTASTSAPRISQACTTTLSLPARSQPATCTGSCHTARRICLMKSAAIAMRTPGRSIGTSQPKRICLHRGCTSTADHSSSAWKRRTSSITTTSALSTSTSLTSARLPTSTGRTPSSPICDTCSHGLSSASRNHLGGTPRERRSFHTIWEVSPGIQGLLTR